MKNKLNASSRVVRVMKYVVFLFFKGELLPHGVLEKFEQNADLQGNASDDAAPVTAHHSQQLYVSEEGDEASPPEWKDFLVL